MLAGIYSCRAEGLSQLIFAIRINTAAVAIAVGDISVVTKSFLTKEGLGAAYDL